MQMSNRIILTFDLKVLLFIFTYVGNEGAVLTLNYRISYIVLI